MGLVCPNFLNNEQIALGGNKYPMYSHLSSCVNLMNVPNCTDEQIIKKRFVQVADTLKKIFCMVVQGLWYRHTFKQAIVKSPLSEHFAVYTDTITPKCSPRNGTFHVYCLYTSGQKLPERTIASQEFVFLHKNRFVCKYKNVKDFEAYLKCVIDEHTKDNIDEVEQSNLLSFIIREITRI